MKAKLWNSVLLAVGIIGVLSPDMTMLGQWLSAKNLGWTIHAIHILGGMALLTAGWERFRTRLLQSKLWNRILFAVGIIGIMAPDMTGFADWLMSYHVSWLTHIAHSLGGLALLAASWSRIAGRLAEPTEPPQSHPAPIST